VRFEGKKFVKVHPEHGISVYINTGWEFGIIKITRNEDVT